MRKGPQTIEKAKQGAYVARSVSSFQKMRLRNGQFRGLIERSDGSFRVGMYDALLQDIIHSSSAAELDGFILTLGVVSNHGNWFTSDNHNKELRVLAQSYDWLLFLTDAGLSQFIDGLLLNPTPELESARDAFLASYSGRRGANRFTKVRMDVDADEALQSYFMAREADIERWFNVISPYDGTLGNSPGRPTNTGRKGLVAMTAGRKSAESLSQHWCTPPAYVDAVRRFFFGSVRIGPMLEPLFNRRSDCRILSA